MKGYRPYSDGTNRRVRTIKIQLLQSDVEAVMEHKGMTQREAEAAIMDRFLCSGVECCGMSLVKDNNGPDDPDFVELVSEFDSDFQTELLHLRCVSMPIN